MIGEGATEDTNYHEVWTVKPLICELSPLGGVGWLAVAWAKWCPIRNFSFQLAANYHLRSIHWTTSKQNIQRRECLHPGWWPLFVRHQWLWSNLSLQLFAPPHIPKWKPWAGWVEKGGTRKDQGQQQEQEQVGGGGGIYFKPEQYPTAWEPFCCGSRKR